MNKDIKIFLLRMFLIIMCFLSALILIKWYEFCSKVSLPKVNIVSTSTE